jgi:hypothetical protein
MGPTGGQVNSGWLDLVVSLRDTLGVRVGPRMILASQLTDRATHQHRRGLPIHESQGS